MKQRAVLAYSGGLDTSVAVRWMIDNYDVEVVTLSANVGQEAEWAGLAERAKAAGAVEAVVLDLREEFAHDYLSRALKANALYENRYPLVSALSRPVIAKHLVDAARDYDCTAVAHGCTGKGNDQVRFEVSVRSLAPDLDILAPVREWGLTRAESIDYAEQYDIPLTATKEQLYSIDDNLWGRAVECGSMEDPWTAPPDDVWAMTRETATEPVEVTIAFEAGVPVAIDGKAMPLYRIVERMNELAGSFGYGRIDMVENRRVGIKSRETYEVPGGLALIEAHRDLEGVCLERDLQREKLRLETRWSELVYDGLWFSPLREAIDAFVDESQRAVTGEVRLKLGPGRCTVTGRRSVYSLYDYGLATYEADDTFDHKQAEGFVRLWGLGLERWSDRQGDVGR